MPIYVKLIEKEFINPVDDSKSVNLGTSRYVRLDASRLNLDGANIIHPFAIIKTLASEFYMEESAEGISLASGPISVCQLMDRFPCVLFLKGSKCMVAALGIQKSSFRPIFPATILSPSGRVTDPNEIDPDQFVAWDRFFVSAPYYTNGVARVFGHELRDAVPDLEILDLGKWSPGFGVWYKIEIPRLVNSAPDENLYYDKSATPFKPVIPVIHGLAPFYWMVEPLYGNADWGSVLNFVLPGKTKSVSEKERVQHYLDPYKGVIPVDTYSETASTAE